MSPVTRVVGLACLPAPGHASHQVSYMHEDGTLYNGDAAGVRIAPGRFVFAPTPPPEIDLEAWERTLDELERRVARAPRADPLRRLRRRRAPPRRAPRRRCGAGRDRVGHGMDEETFVAAARADVAASDPEDADAYDRAAPYWHCYLGLERYWRKRLEAIEPT